MYGPAATFLFDNRSRGEAVVASLAAESICLVDPHGAGAPAEANAAGDQAEPPHKATRAVPANPRTFPAAVRSYLHRLHMGRDRREAADKAHREPEPAIKAPEAAGSDLSPEPAKKNAGAVDESGSAKSELESGPKESNKPAAAGKKNAERGEEAKQGGQESGEKPDAKADKPSWLSAHFQATMVDDYHGPLHSPYASNLSLSPYPENQTSLTSTLFLDGRLWEHDHYSGDLVFNPEIAGGKGFSGVNGLAGFPNGEITRVGVPQPTPYFARLFLRQVWGEGGEQETADDGFNQLATTRDVDRFTLWMGKFAFTDVMDNNRFAHDPRTQMLNWSLLYNGAWDYPANVRGYSYGVFAEQNSKEWAIRYGIMAEPLIANGAPLDPRFTEAFGQALEWEGRWTVNNRVGIVRVMSYLNRAHMGSYGLALQEMPIDPVVQSTRAYRYKYGFCLSADQDVTSNLGVWMRLGWDDGHTETWAFTPIDRTVAIGLLWKGTQWERPDDNVGLGMACNGLARVHRLYLAAGGEDFNIGDGALHYGWETIIEMYYRLSIGNGIFATVDFQEIFNPAYNQDRGPVSALAMVVHAEY